MTEETTETIETVENDVQSHVFADFYPVNPPFGFVGIEREETTGKLKYLVVEPTLTDFEEEILEELKETKEITPCGEAGEYHTLVIDGPMFNQRVEILETNKVLREGRWFLEILKSELKPK